MLWGVVLNLWFTLFVLLGVSDFGLAVEVCVLRLFYGLVFC